MAEKGDDLELKRIFDAAMISFEDGKESLRKILEAHPGSEFARERLEDIQFLTELIRFAESMDSLFKDSRISEIRKGLGQTLKQRILNMKPEELPDATMRGEDILPRNIKTYKGPVEVLEARVGMNVENLIKNMFVVRSHWAHNDVLILASHNGALLYVTKDTKDITSVMNQWEQAMENTSEERFVTVAHRRKEDQLDYLNRLTRESKICSASTYVVGAVDGNMKIFNKGQRLDAAMTAWSGELINQTQDQYVPISGDNSAKNLYF